MAVPALSSHSTSAGQVVETFWWGWVDNSQGSIPLLKKLTCGKELLEQECFKRFSLLRRLAVDGKEPSLGLKNKKQGPLTWRMLD